MENIKKMFGENGMQILFFAVAIVVFYIFILRPKQKDAAKKEDFMKSMKKGIKVVTIGGIRGTVEDVRETEIVLEVDRKGSQITVLREAISIEASKKVNMPEAPKKEKKNKNIV